MVAKLVIGIAALIIIVAIVIIISFWYFHQESEREHEKELREMEQTDKIMGIAEEESSIDAQLERERD